MNVFLHPFIALLLLTLVACGKTETIEDQVINSINKMEEAVDEGKIFDVMAMVAEDFQGQENQLDRRSFMQFMTTQINQNTRISTQLFPITVESDGGNFATGRFQVLVTGGPGAIPDKGRFFDVETTWINDEGDWLLWRANWKPIGSG